jgi:hypothetical protein
MPSELAAVWHQDVAKNLRHDGQPCPLRNRQCDAARRASYGDVKADLKHCERDFDVARSASYGDTKADLKHRERHFDVARQASYGDAKADLKHREKDFADLWGGQNQTCRIVGETCVCAGSTSNES